MRTAIYARVSTTDQNCELQLRELREYVPAGNGNRLSSTSMPVSPAPRLPARRSIA